MDFMENLRQWASQGFDALTGQENVYHRSTGKTQREYENDIDTYKALQTGIAIDAMLSAAGLGAGLGAAGGAGLAHAANSAITPGIIGDASIALTNPAVASAAISPWASGLSATGLGLLGGAGGALAGSGLAGLNIDALKGFKGAVDSRGTDSSSEGTEQSDTQDESSEGSSEGSSNETPSNSPFGDDVSEGDFVYFSYVPGDTFGQKILDLGLNTENGLWGQDGDVNFYTRQLIEQGALDENGNVKLGQTYKLRRRK